MLTGLAIGAIVTSLPNASETVYVSGEQYYYADGTYVQATDDGQYVVVVPPVGAQVSTIPADAELKTIDGKQYFVYSGVYYQALYGGSGMVYVVVADPTA